MILARTTFALALTGFAYSASAADVSFNRDIRPILSANCFACHGSDPAKRKAELRLDDRDFATHPAKSGHIAITPGKPDDSELIKRITSADSDERMPPAKSDKAPLSPDQIAKLRQWIAQGAKYETHWAFVPPVRPSVPAVKNQAWVRNPIDAFVLSQLESAGLTPSPETDKITLLRRVSLDLTGLPPTIAEVDAFLADKSPDAYEKQVDRLLASPHYGECWGRHWLDAARYADSDGFEKDKPRFIWLYRDWVINAFNRDLPYDQFIIQQLAGDQLPRATQDQIVATGFLRNSMLNEEGAINPEQFRMDEIFDRIDAIGKSMLGLTVQCAQCHSHKFDPITQEEYYRLFAFLNNDHEAFHLSYTPEQQIKTADLSRQMKEIEGGLRHAAPDWQDRMSHWEELARKDQPNWTVLGKLEHIGDNDTYFYPQPDGSYLAQGYATTKYTETFTTKVNLNNITAFRLELMTDPNLPAGGPGRSVNGTCAITEFSVEAAPASEPNKKTKIKFSSASADYNQPVRDLEPIFFDKTDHHRVTGPVEFAIDGKDETAWGIDPGPGRRNQDRKAVFNCEKPIDIGGKVILTIHIAENHGGWNSDDNQNNNPGRFRISATADTGSIVADPLPRRVRDILAIAPADRSEAQQSEVFSYWRTTVPEWKETNDKIETLWAQWPQGVTTQTVIARENPRESHILTRGDWLKPTKLVTPGVPAILNALPADAPPTRLTLANWLVDRKSPTTARVFVNRMWQAYFGIGIVATSEDFGTQGQWPSHLELLDWLACEFMEPTENDGPNKAWSIKHIQRLIVTSATYRQSSRVTEEELTRDPYNRLLARGPRNRVEGEIVHDIALSASGLLNDEMGGRSVMPPAPAFLFMPPTSYAPFPWHDETGPERYRRAVYTFRRRSTPFPALQTFDAPNGESSCVRRSISNSPLQALVGLNEPMFVDCARALARKTVTEGGASADTRLVFAFRSVLSRPPTDDERKQLLALLEKEKSRFADGWLNPNEVATGNKEAPNDLPPGVTPTELASWTVVSRVLLNLDETITKE
jgi:mono/diheme cytochrome c family protein